MEEKSIGEKLITWARNSLSLKLILIFFLVLILLIPGEAVKDLVKERSNRNQDVTREINKKWGDRQLIEGAVIVIPYKTHANSPTIYEGLFFPDELNINANLASQIKKRGIYKTAVYSGDFELKAEFLGLKRGTLSPSYVLLWDQAYLLLGLNNLNSLTSEVEATWNNTPYKFEAGLESKATQYTNNQPSVKIFTDGLHLDVPIDKTKDNENERFTLNVKFKLNGGDELNFLPLALGRTNVEIQADWKNPSFIGASLPDSHDINDNGFVANWTNNNYANAISNPQFNQNIKAKQFGVSLLQPVSHYQKVTRAIKYSSLFLVLTFLLVMLFERLTKLRIHALQYLLVGLAMILFYVLLLSISEYLPFEITYIIASVATIGLIGTYSVSLFAKKQFSIILTLSLVVLYAFLFFLLQAQDYSLLIGSLSLFVLLALFMYLTRNINKERNT